MRQTKNRNISTRLFTKYLYQRNYTLQIKVLKVYNQQELMTEKLYLLPKRTNQAIPFGYQRQNDK